MSNVKMLRGQVRQIVKELLPEVFQAEAYIALVKQVEDRLKKMEDNQRDLMTMIIRQSTPKAPVKFVPEDHKPMIKVPE